MLIRGRCRQWLHLLCVQAQALVGVGEQQHGDVDQQIDQTDSVAHWIALGIGVDELGQGNTHLHQPGGFGQGATGQRQEGVEQ
ncbi:hypothetical protein D3C77_268580 [compost metagenome]